MKRALIVILLAVILTGCGSSGYTSAEEVLESDRFVKAEKTQSYYIVYDRHTKVMYYVSTTAYNMGCLCPLYNADGTLMLWEGK